MEWISVKDKLPDDGDLVFFVFNTGDSNWYKYPLNLVRGDFKLLKSGWTFRDDMRPVNNEAVTHWSYVPEGPK